MSKSIDKPTGTVTGTKEMMMFNPTTGLMEVCTISALANYITGGDVTAPTVVSCTCPNGAANTLVMVFSEAVTGVAVGDYSFKKNGSAWSDSSVSGSGTTWTFTMATSAISTDTLLRSYSGTGTIDASSNALASFTDVAVTNSVAGSYDSDAQAFFTAYTITDTTQKNAVDALVVAIKAQTGLWAKMKAIYPIVGGDAAKHAGNLKTPGTYDLTFTGGWTHASTGALPNGTTGYATSGLNCLSILTQFSIASGVYSRTSTVPGTGNDRMLFGVLNSGSQISIDFYNTGGTDRVQSCATGASFVTENPKTSYTRLTVLSRTANNVSKLFRDGTQLSTTDTTTITAAQPNSDIWFGALNNSGSAAFYSFYEMAFGFIADGLADADVTALNTAVNTYQTSLSRNV